MSSQDNSYSSANEEIVRSLDAIKARAELVAGKPDNCEPTEKEWDALTDGAIHDVPALLAAVEAVLVMHKPEATGYGDWVCGACISAGSHDWESTAYPCPTVTAIQSALGETDANN